MTDLPIDNEILESWLGGPVPEEKRKEVGISDDLVRLSVGVEDIDDLLNDLKQALL